MRLVAATLSPFRLALRTPLATAHGEIRERRGTILRWVDAEGAFGIGEASPLTGFGSCDLAESRRALHDATRALLAASPSSLEDALDWVDARAPRDAAVRHALDLALHDLAARRAGVSLAHWLARQTGVSAPSAVWVNALVAGRTPRDAASDAVRARDAGFACVKLKVASSTIEDDVAKVDAVRNALGRDIGIRLDANGGWSVDDAQRALSRLEPCGIETIEQPVAADDLGGLARVRAGTCIPVAADEAACDEESIARLLDHGAVDVIVLKPAALGGLTPALRAAARIRAAGVGCYVTTLLDAAVARAGARAFAAALPGPLLACGLATGALLSDDIAAETPPERGVVRASAEVGIGTVPDFAALARVADGAMLELGACG